MLVGKRLREQRKRLRMTQEELAAGICNRSYVSQIEKGQVIPSPEILDQLAKRLGINLQELWNESPNPTFTQIEIKNALRHIQNRIEEQDWESVKKWLQKLDGAPLAPMDEGIYCWARGRLAQAATSLREAESLYERSVQLVREFDDPFPLIRALLSLGSCCLQAAQPEKACPCLREAYHLITLHQVNGLLRIEILYYTGVMHSQLREWYSAAEQFKQAIQLNQLYNTYYRSGELSLELGRCYLHLRYDRDAEEELKRSLAAFSLLPTHKRLPESHYMLGWLYRKQNRYRLAEKHLSKATDLNRPAKEAVFESASLELAKLYVETDRVEQATELCHRMLRSSSKRVRIEAELLLANATNDPLRAEAVAYSLKKSLTESPSPEQRHLHLRAFQTTGTIYARLEQYRPAVTWFTTSFEEWSEEIKKSGPLPDSMI
ncbi:tetratricopeptide repeat protein [Brevibacillus humidisoli]|uniref:helix-turn-helix domain-containing protein n=1 Tax=Brevibacillus humidisoli TaxID=2895522 RepID=UPI001E3C7271|nr:tetratricopeptide repeat protein [Brevibacillus humidisoli]UFJ41886.1 tetratricopeptide repeat protein [Brevibacillus humidisoli]